MGHIQTSRLIPAPSAQVYAHVTNLLTLPEDLRGILDLEFASEIPPLKEQVEIEATLSRYGVTAHALLRIEELVPEQRFTYRQVRGIWRTWRHSQVLKAHGKKTTLLTDLVDFRAPMGLIGALLDDLWFRREIESVLNARLDRIESFFSEKGHVDDVS